MPDDKNHLTPKSRNLTTSCRECFIPVHYDNITDLVLIIRIQKLFKGDIEKDILFYMKGKSVSPSNTHLSKLYSYSKK